MANTGIETLTRPTTAGRMIEIARSIATRTICEMTRFAVDDDDPFAEVDSDRRDHAGSKAIRIDAHLGDFVDRVLRELPFVELALGAITCFQEERRAAYTERDDRARCRVIVDPLDGSSIFSGFGIGGVSVLVYSNLNSDGTWRLYAGAIALSTGFLFSYQVHRRTVRRPQIHAQVSAHTFDPHTSGGDINLQPFDLEDRTLRKKGVGLISASASEGRRTAAEQYLRSMGELNLPFQSGFAGNLSIWGGLFGTASLIHDPKPATLHDANYLVFLSATDWFIYDLEARQQMDVEAIFNVEPRAGVTEELRVPPVVAVRDERLIQGLLN